MTVNVMFVCLGNICRSPTAHGLFAAKVQGAGLQNRIQVSSAGTGGWHAGSPPDARSIRIAQQRGIDLSQLRARQVQASDFGKQHYMLAMDLQNLTDLRLLAPAEFDGHLDLFLSFADDASHREVPDPYYGGDEGFRLVLELIDSASDGLLQHIRKTHLGSD